MVWIDFYTIGTVVVPVASSVGDDRSSTWTIIWVLIFLGEGFSNNILIGGVLLQSAVAFNVVASIRYSNRMEYVIQTSVIRTGFSS